MNSLRAELLGIGPKSVPDFTSMLPSGWAEFGASAAFEKELLALASDRLRGFRGALGHRIIRLAVLAIPDPAGHTRAAGIGTAIATDR